MNTNVTHSPVNNLRPKIVVVDDEQMDQELFSKAISTSCHNADVQCYSTKIDCLNGIKGSQQHLDMILVDVELGMDNGLDLVRDLRECAECSNIPVVIFSGYLTDKIRSEALSAGASSYMPKPSSWPELRSNINELMDVFSITTHQQ